MRIGFGCQKRERDEPGQAHGPERRVDGGHGAASVERNDGKQIEEVEEEAREGERDPETGESSASPKPQTTTEPRVPRIGRRRATRASFQASAGICFIRRRRRGRG